MIVLTILFGALSCTMVVKGGVSPVNKDMVLFVSITAIGR